MNSRDCRRYFRGNSLKKKKRNFKVSDDTRSCVLIYCTVAKHCETVLLLLLLLFAFDRLTVKRFCSDDRCEKRQNYKLFFDIFISCNTG